MAAAEHAVAQTVLPPGVVEALQSQLRSVAAAAAEVLPSDVLALNAQWLEARAVRAWTDALQKENRSAYEITTATSLKMSV